MPLAYADSLSMTFLSAKLQKFSSHIQGMLKQTGGNTQSDDKFENYFFKISVAPRSKLIKAFTKLCH